MVQAKQHAHSAPAHPLEAAHHLAAGQAAGAAALAEPVSGT